MKRIRQLACTTAVVLPLLSLPACQGDEARQEGIGTERENSPGGSLGTTGTGADEPAPTNRTNDE